MSKNTKKAGKAKTSAPAQAKTAKTIQTATKKAPPPAGIDIRSTRQIRVLKALAKKPLGPTKLGAQLYPKYAKPIATTAVMTTLKKLCDRGLLKKTNGEAPRSKLYQPTAAGLKTLAKLEAR